eukprot:gene21041-26992_t
MLAATFLAIFFVPMFFRIITDRKLKEPRSTAQMQAEARRTMKRMHYTLSLLALPVLLVACAGAPPAVAPNTTMELPAAAAQTQPVRADWWTLYGDAQLDALVAEALANNTDLARAAARIDESRALVRLARADALPNVAATAGAV